MVIGDGQIWIIFLNFTLKEIKESTHSKSRFDGNFEAIKCQPLISIYTQIAAWQEATASKWLLESIGA